MQYSRFVAALIAAAALPAAEFSTYIGDENAWRITKLVIDASGNTYVAGSRTFNLSLDPIHPDNRTEAIVVKLDTTGKRLLLATIGGKGNDIANAVAIDRAGNIYIAGSTTSPNFPVRNALYPEMPPNDRGIFSTPGFVTKFAPDGSIVYSTYFPSPPQSIAVDADGAVYLAGTTFLTDFPTTPGLPRGPVASTPIVSAAFLTKIAPSGDKIAYSTRISGQNKPCGAGSSCFLSSRGASGAAAGVDGAGNAYLAGNSDVTDLPTTAGVLTPTGSGAFVAKVNSAGTSLAWLTYLGKEALTIPPIFRPANHLDAMAVDSAGNAFLAGSTWDATLPFSNEFHGSGAGSPTDAFAMKLNPSGTAVIWGSYLGGDSIEQSDSATLDSTGNFWLAGLTRSTEFPNADGWSAGEDFVVRYDVKGELSYSARYPTGTVRQTIAADALLRTAAPAGVVSAVAASPHPAVRPWIVGPIGGQVAAGEVIEIFGPHIGGPGAQVFFDDIPAQLLYSGDQQINTIVPWEIARRETVRVRINSGPEFVAGVLPAIPQIFALVNQDGAVNTMDNPAPVGSIMTAWVSGSGYATSLGYLYTGDGKPVTKVYEGGYQINFVAPQGSSLVLTSGNYASAPVTIYVQ